VSKGRRAAHWDHEPQLVGARTARSRVRRIWFARTSCPRSVRWCTENLNETSFPHGDHEPAVCSSGFSRSGAQQPKGWITNKERFMENPHGLVSGYLRSQRPLLETRLHP